MRSVSASVFAIAVSTSATIASAQTIRASEPLVLAPYESALVYDSSCAAGKVLRVTGAIRGLRRKRTCVGLDDARASLGASVQ